MSKMMVSVILLLLALAALPFALVYRSRAVKSDVPAYNIIADMDQMPRFNPQAPAKLFADGRAMRPTVEGTVAREDLTLRNEKLNDPANPRMVDGEGKNIVIDSAETYAAVMLGRVRPAGMSDEDFNKIDPTVEADYVKNYVASIPTQFAVTKDFLIRGQERFTIYCGPCHGNSGHGDGMVQRRADALGKAGATPAPTPMWVPPKNLHDPVIVGRPDGSLYNTITNGKNSMAGYGKQISVPDRWAIVAYTRALQRSQATKTEGK